MYAAARGINREFGGEGAHAARVLFDHGDTGLQEFGEFVLGTDAYKQAVSLKARIEEENAARKALKKRERMNARGEILA